MPDRPAILIVGASRGLGLALAEEFVTRDWTVIGTVRGTTRTELQDLADRAPDRVRVELLDMTDDGQIAKIRERVEGHRIDVLFVCAGVTTDDPMARVGAVSADEFAEVMLTNALAPMRAIEALQDLVAAKGLIGVMSSGQGSIANNQTGQREVYRASKAALNMLMKSFAARPENAELALLVLAPGWIRTALGGPDAPFTLEESAPMLADVLVAKAGRAGIEYLDRFGQPVPW